MQQGHHSTLVLVVGEVEEVVVVVVEVLMDMDLGMGQGMVLEVVVDMVM